MITDKIMERAMADLAAAVSVEEITARSIEEIQAKYSLSDELLTMIAGMVLGVRLEALEDGRMKLGLDIAELVAKSRQWGLKQAELEILAMPLPWTREQLVEMCDRVVDHYAETFVDLYDKAGEVTKMVIADLCHNARLGFVERIVELSGTASPEGRA